MRRQYPFHLIEPKWQQFWDKEQTFKAFNPGDTLADGHPFTKRHGANAMSRENVAAGEAPRKYYVLDMFPYPSGAGLHVGHPEGYTATDILARYRRATGSHVLHPIGWDAFGLPAEQYAVKTGQHPRITTETNVANFTRQIKSLGFSYDWSREVNTTDPNYFKWSQWIFLQLYNSWFNPETNKAESIETLVYPSELSSEAGNVGPASCLSPDAPVATNEPESPARAEASGDRLEAGPTLATRRRAYRDSKRLAFVSEAPVNWCPELGTVLANEEVIDGKSEVGGFPVVRKPMRQWMLRITAFAQKLLDDLNTIEWPDSLKEMQRNWIGRSEGATVSFKVVSESVNSNQSGDSRSGTDSLNTDLLITVFTTRPDTLFGATYMVLSPEHKLLEQITVPDQKQAIADYQVFAAGKSDLERTELAKVKTGVFTGAHAINPVNGEKIPIWIADYVLATYGTGAIMAVPAHDERDFEFAAKFNLPCRPVVQPSAEWIKENIGNFVEVKDDGSTSPSTAKVYLKAENELFFSITSAAYTETGTAINSANDELSLNDLPTAEAKAKITAWLEEKGLGEKCINFKLRDWLFSRQRYWGEPFPIIWRKDAEGNLQHEALSESDLPLLPPSLEDYKPTSDGQPPLARATDWVSVDANTIRETNTMPQWAGSCWYYLRYADAQNEAAFVGSDAESYWMGTAASSKSQVSSVQSENLNLKTENSPTVPGVDLYVGGTEHAVLHLLYARFWHKVLFDLGHVSTAEPFFKLINQGLIMGEMEFTAFSHSDGTPCSAQMLKDIEEEASSDGRMLVGTHKQSSVRINGHRVPKEDVEKTPNGFALAANLEVLVDGRSFKMSKSRKNVISPDAVVAEFGADAFRLYEMFMGPLQDSKPWNTKGVEGVYRFLGRVWRLFIDEQSEKDFELAETTATEDAREELLSKLKITPAICESEPTAPQLKTLHACIKKVTEDLDGMRFNTAISAMMVFVNDAITWETKPASAMKTFLQVLAPSAPHIAEELWSRLFIHLGQAVPSLTYASWPTFDPSLLVEDTLTIPVQVNGKLRDKITLAADAAREEFEQAALASSKVAPFIEGKTVRKIIVVPKKLVNIVAS